MSSIFDLAVSKEQLSSSNDGVSRRSYSKLAPSRDVTDTNFSNGQISFKFETSGVKRWLPAESYLRMRVELTDGTGAAPTVAFGAAPNMSFCAGLFQSAEMRMNNTTVSRVEDFMPQIDALETRMNKSKSWVDSLGYSSNWYQPSQTERLNEVATDGGIDGKSIPEYRTDTNMGYPTDASVAGTAATQIITIGVANHPANLAVSQQFKVGDYFEITHSIAGANELNGVRSRIIAVADSANVNTCGFLTLEPGSFTNDVGQSVVTQFRRIRYDNQERDVHKFGVSWQPPLSLFKVDKALPAGRFELVLNPQSAATYQKRAIESILGQASKNSQLPGTVADAANIKVKIVDMYLYAAMVDAERVENLTYLLDLDTTQCQADTISNSSFGQKAFSVSPSTTALTVAYQDLRAGENTAISASKFRCYENGVTPSLPQELKLERFFVNYAGQSRPESDADPSFVVGQTDYTQQLYTQTQMEVGAYHDQGGAETIQDWHDRGAYYTQKFPRDASDRSTAVNVHQGFNAADVANMRILLFSHAKQVLMVTVEQGQTTNVVLEDA